MRRRLKGGAKTKSRQRKAATPRRRNGAATRRRGSVSARQKSEIARLSCELDEASQQQAATAEILQIISGSPGDLQPAFGKMLAHAARICEAKYGNVFRLQGDTLPLVASHNTPAALIEARRRVHL